MTTPAPPHQTILAWWCFPSSQRPGPRRSSPSMGGGRRPAAASYTAAGEKRLAAASRSAIPRAVDRYKATCSTIATWMECTMQTKSWSSIQADRQSDPQALHPSACLDGTTSSHASVHQRTPSSTTFSNCEQRKPRQNSARYPVNAGLNQSRAAITNLCGCRR